MPAPATTLRERRIEDMNLHRLCRTTQHGYLRDITRFAIWLGRPPDTATEEDLGITVMVWTALQPGN
jgi:hypothetical protein